MVDSPRDRVRARILAETGLPDDLAKQVARLECDPREIKQILDQFGRNEVLRYLGTIEANQQRFEKWGPRLRTFAADVRRIHPPPSIESLSQKEQAKPRILAPLVQAVLPRVRHRVTSVYVMPLYVMSLIAPDWADTGDAVLLAENEAQRWWDEHAEALNDFGAASWCEQFGFPSTTHQTSSISTVRGTFHPGLIHGWSYKAGGVS